MGGVLNSSSAAQALTAARAFLALVANGADGQAVKNAGDLVKPYAARAIKEGQAQTVEQVSQERRLIAERGLLEQRAGELRGRLEKLERAQKIGRAARLN